ncbi:MAG: hypothetical protein ACOC1G_06525 [Phycisphaeraceae bacterium]
MAGISATGPHRYEANRVGRFRAWSTLLAAVLILATAGAGNALQAAAEDRTVAILVNRPSNILAWSHLDERAALMLGCDRVLSDVLQHSPHLSMRGAFHVNGAFRGVESGLYFPTGDSTYARWKPFVDADIYIECDIDRQRLVWTAGTTDGQSFRSEEIAQPYRNPHAVAAALVKLVFKASGTPLTDAARKEIARGESKPPQLLSNGPNGSATAPTGRTTRPGRARKRRLARSSTAIPASPAARCGRCGS